MAAWNGEEEVRKRHELHTLAVHKGSHIHAPISVLVVGLATFTALLCLPQRLERGQLQEILPPDTNINVNAEPKELAEQVINAIEKMSPADRNAYAKNLEAQLDKLIKNYDNQDYVENAKAVVEALHAANNSDELKNEFKPHTELHKKISLLLNDPQNTFSKMFLSGLDNKSWVSKTATEPSSGTGIVSPLP